MGQNKVDIHELNISNKEFWFSFFAVSYPNGYDEETDMSVDDLVGEYADVQWWDEFTGNLLTQENGVILFWLLLPLAKVDKDVEMVERKLSEMLETFFESSDCNEIAKCVVKQLMEEEV